MSKTWLGSHARVKSLKKKTCYHCQRTLYKNTKHVVAREYQNTNNMPEPIGQRRLHQKCFKKETGL